MPRFYLAPDQCRPPELALEGDEAHHAIHVLRLRKGDAATILNGVGDEFGCEVLSASGRCLMLRVIRHLAHPVPKFRLTLIQAIPKGKLMESIVQKATELGAFRIVPLLSERVVVQLSEKEAVAKAGKWQQVAIEAMKQSGSPWLPHVDTPETLSRVILGLEPVELPLLASLEPDRKHPRAFLAEFCRDHGRKPISASVWIGPEGDFSPRETRELKSAGARPVTLGPLVLRTETAAVYCLSVLNYELTWAEEPAGHGP